MSAEHLSLPELKKLHDDNVQRKTTEGGACLCPSATDARFDKKGNQITCNYRYQAYEQAKSEQAIRTRLEGYSWAQQVSTSVYQTLAGGWAPSYYIATLPAPQAGDWHVEGPTRPVPRGTKTIPPGMNFTKDTWPYWNNAHHIIPKGMFNSMITEQPSPVPNVMRKALLAAKYNINHKVNMFMLPQDKEVATILKLTRHIQLRHNDAPGVKEIFTDHPIYSDMVRGKMNSIIANYKSMCDQAKPDGHKVPNADLDKTKLESLSKDLMNQILAWGAQSPGDSLDKKSQEANAEITA